MKDLSLHILDIVQNSIRAKAGLIEIDIQELPESDQLIITITDNGTGMTENQVKLAIDPFYTSRNTRKVGLGLSLFKQNAEISGGKLDLISEYGKGTKVTAIFGLSHIDRPVLGDLTGTLLLLICDSETIEYVYKHKTPHGEYELDTREIRQTLDGVPVNHPEVRAFLREMLNENLEQIQISE